MLLPPNTGRSPTSSTGMPPNMVIPQPPHPRSRPATVSTNIPSYHAPADRTERSTKDPTPVSSHQVKIFYLFFIKVKKLLIPNDDDDVV